MPGLVVDEHAALAALIVDRDPDEAQIQIAAHIEGAYSRLLAVYDNPDEACQENPAASA